MSCRKQLNGQSHLIGFSLKLSDRATQAPTKKFTRLLPFYWRFLGNYRDQVHIRKRRVGKSHIAGTFVHEVQGRFLIGFGEAMNITELVETLAVQPNYYPAIRHLGKGRMWWEE